MRATLAMVVLFTLAVVAAVAGKHLESALFSTAFFIIYGLSDG